MVNCSVNKNLVIGQKLIIILGGKLVDVTIKEKTPMDKGDIGFLIETDKGELFRIKHRYLDVYHVLKN